MHFATLLTASVLATVVSANPIIPLQNRDVSDADIAAITPDNNFGAPIPPWLPNSTPGWVITDDADLQNEYPDLTDSSVCSTLDAAGTGYLCPSSDDTALTRRTVQQQWDAAFTGQTAATQASGYMTYGLVDTVDACKAMCLRVPGCKFISVYHDNYGKGDTTGHVAQFTCSLYNACQTVATATNAGGQDQGNGGLTFITDSAGYCLENSCH